jgi:hypothetical protein
MQSRVFLMAMLLMMCGGPPLAAQTTGQIEGIVRDPSGLPVPGVALSIVETRTDARRPLQTDQRGWYLAPNLVPGAYEIAASHPGFRSEVRRGVTLSAGRSVRIDFLLQLGEARDTVVVVNRSRSMAGTCSTSPRNSRALPSQPPRSNP